MLTRAFRDKWADQLEFGDLHQYRGDEDSGLVQCDLAYDDYYEDREPIWETMGYCCLGVAMLVVDKPIEPAAMLGQAYPNDLADPQGSAFSAALRSYGWVYPDRDFATLGGNRKRGQSAFADMNDRQKLTFPEIAKIVRALPTNENGYDG